MRFNRRINIGERANRPGNSPRRNLVARFFKPVQVPIHLRIEPGKGQPHRRRLGMNTVTATDAHRILMLQSTAFERGQKSLHIGDQNICRPHQLDIETGVEHIRGRHPLMHKPRLIIADNLRKMGQKRDDIMLGHSFNFVNARHIELDVLGLPDRIGIFLRDHPQLGLRIARVRLDLIPDAKLTGCRPNGHHFRPGIAFDHG